METITRMKSKAMNYGVTGSAHRNRRLHILYNSGATLCGRQIDRYAKQEDWGRLQCSTCLDMKAKQGAKSNVKG